MKIGRVTATVVAFVTGFLVLLDMAAQQSWGDIFGISGLLVRWATIITTFAVLLGFVNVMTVHVSRLRSRKPCTIYSAVLLISMLGTLLLGIGGPTSTNSQFIFNFILQPLEATFSALLALFIATAAFRAFRIHDLESFFFVLFALIVLLGQLPLGIYLWSELPMFKDWILTVPTMAGIRGILLGVALGTIASGLRILLGIDRPYTD